jgi:hypothetical protein
MTLPAGIDVASYQSSTYDTKGLSYVFVKATESTGYRNPRYDAQVAHARAHGLIVGHYHFAHGGNAVAQADYFLAVAQIKPGDLIAYDWEEAHTSQADRDAWMKHVKAKRPNNKVVLYCNKAFWKGRDTESYAGDGLWIADPDRPAGKPDVQHPWVFHQYSTAGGIDHDVANFPSVEALKAWASGTVAKPPTEKPPVAVPVTKPPVKTPPVVHPVLPHVSLAHVIEAARTDPHAAQGHQSHPNDVKPVELALVAEKLLDAAHAHDGSFGSLTVHAYGKWQERLGFSGDAANGIPGHESLVKLGERHGFTVGA